MWHIQPAGQRVLHKTTDNLGDATTLFSYCEHFVDMQVVFMTTSAH